MTAQRLAPRREWEGKPGGRRTAPAWLSFSFSASHQRWQGVL